MDTAIDLFKTFGFWGAIGIALIIAIIKGYPELLKIIQNRQENKKKETDKKNKVENDLNELTELVTKRQTFLENNITEKLSTCEANDKVMQDSMVSLLRSQIVSKAEHYLEIGYLPDYARFCLTDLFKNYEQLGGNHGVEKLVDQVLDLPPKKKSKKS